MATLTTVKPTALIRLLDGIIMGNTLIRSGYTVEGSFKHSGSAAQQGNSERGRVHAKISFGRF